MKFIAMLEKHRMQDFYYQLGKRKVFRVGRKEDGLFIDYTNFKSLPLDHMIDFTRRMDLGKSQMTQMINVSEALYHGPKIVKLDNMDYQAFSHIDLNLKLEDYNQPFGTVIIELPENLSKRFEVIDPYEKKHKPEFVIVSHFKDASALAISTFLSSDTILSCMIEDVSITIEEYLLQSHNLRYDGSMVMNNEEEQMHTNIMRICLNAILFLEDFGAKKLGPANPSHFARLEKRSKDGKNPAQAQKELRMQPILYAFEQKIKIFNRVQEASTNGAGHMIGPHWRRGHYKMQPYGEKNSLRKRIRIAATQVNWHLFLGEEANTTYEISKG